MSGFPLQDALIPLKKGSQEMRSMVMVAFARVGDEWKLPDISSDNIRKEVEFS